MAINKRDIEYVALLARLKIADKEIEHFTRQLHDIISYIDKLKEVDTKNTPPTTHLLPLKNVFRKDAVKPFREIKGFLDIAPRKKDNFFEVPKVIEEA